MGSICDTLFPHYLVSFLVIHDDCSVVEVRRCSAKENQIQQRLGAITERVNERVFRLILHVLRQPVNNLMTMTMSTMISNRLALFAYLVKFRDNMKL